MNRLRERIAPLSGRLTELWETHAAPRFEALQERDQRILKLAAMILPAFIVVFGILLPVHDKLITLEHQAGRAQAQAAEAELLAKRLQTQGGGHKVSGDLLTGIEQIARSTKTRKFMTRIHPEPGTGDGSQRLRLSLKAVPYDRMLALLAALADHGLGLTDLRLQTAEPGKVHVQAVIRSG